MKTTKMPEYETHAEWNEDKQRYECGGLNITSEDGDNWIDDETYPASGESFDAAHIELRGGPRDGVLVF